MTRRERRFNTWRPWVAGLALLIGLGASAALAQQQPAPGSAIEEPTVGIDTESADTAPGAAPVVPVSDEAPIPTSNLWEIITRGGLLMIPIAACSLILLAFVLERTISLRHGRVIPRPFVKRFLEQLRDRSLNQQRAAELCEENGSPVAEVFGGAVRKWGRPSVEVEQAVIDAGERVTNGLRRYLRVLNGVATVAPLLGLLGTVVGMIQAFNDIATAEALGRPERLAEGISQALLTTAFGLSVAIPALIFYLFFVSRVDRLIIEIDALGQDVATMISAEGLEGKVKPTNSRRRTKGAAA